MVVSINMVEDKMSAYITELSDMVSTRGRVMMMMVAVMLMIMVIKEENEAYITELSDIFMIMTVMFFNRCLLATPSPGNLTS